MKNQDKLGINFWVCVSFKPHDPKRLINSSHSNLVTFTYSLTLRCISFSQDEFVWSERRESWGLPWRKAERRHQRHLCPGPADRQALHPAADREPAQQDCAQGGEGTETLESLPEIHVCFLWNSQNVTISKDKTTSCTLLKSVDMVMKMSNLYSTHPLVDTHSFTSANRSTRLYSMLSYLFI